MQSLGPSLSTTAEPRKAGRAHSKYLNLRTVLQTTLDRHTTNRAEVARLTGLTRATVSSLVADLIDDDLIMEAGVAPSAGGKPPTNIRINPNGRHIAVLDLSARPFRGLIVDMLLRPIGDVIRSEPSDNHHDAVRALIRRLVARTTTPLLGVSIASPGVIADDGTVLEATNLGWRNHPLAADLRAEFDLPIHVINDAHASAIAAHAELVRERRSAGVPTGDLLLVRIADGVGAGIVLGGGLHLGSHRAAGEIGHVVVALDGSECRCGNSGCLETIASRAAIIRAITGTDVIDAGITLDMIATSHGQDAVHTALQTAGSALGEVASVLVNALDVSEIVVHTDADAAGVIAEATRRELQRRVLPALRDDLGVHTMSDPNMPLLGAAALMRSALIGIAVA